MLPGSHICGKNSVVSGFLRRAILAFLIVFSLGSVSGNSHSAAQTTVETPVVQLCTKRRLTSLVTAYLIQRCFDENRIMALRRAILRRQLKLDAQNHATATKLMDLLGISQATLNNLLRLLSPDDVDVENQAEEFSAALNYYRVLERDLYQLDAGDQQHHSFTKIVEAIANGNWNDAKTLILVMETRALAEQRQLSPDKPVHSEAAAISELLLAQIALVRGNYDAAARHFNSAADYADEKSSAGLTFQESAAEALYDGAQRRWNEHSLQKAIGYYRHILNIRSKRTTPSLWAQTQSKLGNSILRLGVGKNSIPLIAGAISAFDAALEIRTQIADPKAWAETTADLAGALAQLGSRRREKNDLRDAVSAYQSVVAQTPFEADPSTWVELQTDLGNTLWLLGRLESGGEALKEAIVTYKKLLTGFDKNHQLRDWGATQNNIGAVYFLLAERDRSVDNARNAVAAFEASLDAYQKASAVYFISGVRKNLAAARSLYKRQSPNPAHSLTPAKKQQRKQKQ